MLGQLDLSVLKPSLPFLWTGLKFSANLTLIAMSGGIAIGTLLAMARLGSSRPLTAVASAYVNLMRSIPLLMVILWFFSLIPLIIGKPIGAEYSAPIGFPMISGITRKNQRITMSSGMERMRFTYADATAVRGRLFPSRAMAKSVPIAIPPLIAIRVRVALNLRPVQIKGRLGLRTV